MLPIYGQTHILFPNAGDVFALAICERKGEQCRTIRRQFFRLLALFLGRDIRQRCAALLWQLYRRYLQDLPILDGLGRRNERDWLAAPGLYTSLPRFL